MSTQTLAPAEPQEQTIPGFEQLYHVVLLDDDEHSYDYVIEMLGRLFLIADWQAYRHAVEVDTTGRTIVLTCDRPAAEFARDQIQSYGPDPRMPKSVSSMRAEVVPASLRPEIGTGG